MHSQSEFHTIDLAGSAVLLIEDDDKDLELLRHAFQNARIANPLVEVKNGQRAIQYLSGDGAFADRARYPIPFLVLLDLRLPQLSGFQVLEWIREQPEFSDLLVVVLTNSDRVLDVTKAHHLGANSYLVKPASFAELVEMVKGIKGRWLMLDRYSSLHPHEFNADRRAHSSNDLACGA